MGRIPSVPKLRCKVSNGKKYARVTLPDGTGGRKDVALGKWGSKEARLEYEKVLATWVMHGRRLPDKQAESDLTLNELMLLYYKHAEVYYGKSAGPVSSELNEIKLALRALRPFGAALANVFGPVALEKVRDAMIVQPIVARSKATDPATGEVRWVERVVRVGLARSNVNKRVDRIRRMFKWAVAKDHVRVEVYQRLACLENLQAGRSAARETKKIKPVSEALVSDSLPHLPPVIADMVRLLLLTGARAGEIASMRGCDLDTSGAIWLYTVAQHKTAHHGHSRVVAIGPKAQEIVKRHLSTDLQRYLFRPIDSVAAFRAEQRQNRQSPVQPSQTDRRKAKPKKQPGDRYTVACLGRAIIKACDRGGLPRWHLHQLRHSHATTVRRAFDLDSAQAALGHTSANVTAMYADLALAKAVEVAARIG
jgi:integrase